MFALLSAEGLTAERYLDSPQVHQAQQVRPPLSFLSLSQSLTVLRPLPSPVPPTHPQDIATFKRKAKQVILRPGVFGGALGAANVAGLATPGWFAYDRFNDASAWTPHNLNIAGLGMLAWSGGQG